MARGQAAAQGAPAVDEAALALARAYVDGMELAV